MEKIVKKKINTWLTGNYEENAKAKIKHLLATDTEEIIDSFYKDLEFGTGGLRGIMGVGTNRVNKYTIGQVTQALANYLIKYFSGQLISVVIGYDSRNHSQYFAKVTADIFTANNIKVYLFNALRPTPELSFAIRYLKCQSGVMITASHNPKEYNGYKVYWDDGGQIVSPHDKNISLEVSKIDTIDRIKFDKKNELIQSIGENIDRLYIEEIKKLSLSPQVIHAQNNIKIVFTSIHGTGITLVPEVLKKLGFTKVYIVDEQSKPDGNFPTVLYPNPEEAEALQMALEKAKTIDADILLGTDPDSDRVGIAVKNHRGEFHLLNGNQTGVLLFHYIITLRKEKGLTSNKDFIAKTIVTTQLIDKIAKKNNITCKNTLTGFKYIATLIRKLEAERNFVVGCEESYGYMIGDFVRDKDAISAVAMICELAAYAKNNNTTLWDMLLDIYIEYGFYKEKLISITKKGKRGAEEIEEMMTNFRENISTQLGSLQVKIFNDYFYSIAKNLEDGTQKSIDLPQSNVLQFILEDGSVISARPSGTEPKIKFYFSVNSRLSKKEAYEKTALVLDEKIDKIIRDLGLR